MVIEEVMDDDDGGGSGDREGDGVRVMVMTVEEVMERLMLGMIIS